LCELPTFESPFSTFAFQPGRRRLLIATADEKVLVFHLGKSTLLPSLGIQFGSAGGVAANTIVFDPANRDHVVIASSHRAVMAHTKKPSSPHYQYPYKDILFFAYPADNQIVIFEKPWVFTMNSLPKVFRAKRFLSTNESALPRY
jgi:hypothetical protein